MPRSSATIGSPPRPRRSGFEERQRRGPRPIRRRAPSARVGRHLPVGGEAAEVVDAHEVGELEAAAQAVDPPAVAVLRHAVPAVERVAPALAGGAEVVGRHAGDVARPAALVEVEQLLMRPHVGAVVRDVDRQVAEQADTAPRGGAAQLPPLGEEEELHEAVVARLGQAARRAPPRAPPRRDGRAARATRTKGRRRGAPSARERAPSRQATTRGARRLRSRGSGRATRCRLRGGSAPKPRAAAAPSTPRRPRSRRGGRGTTARRRTQRAGGVRPPTAARARSTADCRRTPRATCTASAPRPATSAAAPATIRIPQRPPSRETPRRRDRRRRRRTVPAAKWGGEGFPRGASVETDVCATWCKHDAHRQSRRSLCDAHDEAVTCSPPAAATGPAARCSASSRSRGRSPSSSQPAPATPRRRSPSSRRR